jgi:hypothetical protein
LARKTSKRAASIPPADRILFEDVAATTAPQHMDKALVQELVRRRIANRRLPLGRAVGVREMSGDGQSCDACDEPIRPGSKLVLAIVSLEWTSVRFHSDCYRVWDAERQTLFSDNGGRHGR